jgi:hypothetical protein
MIVSGGLRVEDFPSLENSRTGEQQEQNTEDIKTISTPARTAATMAL